MGAVYEAVHATIGRRVAIKVLHPEFARNEEVTSRFFNEARAVNLVEHPGIVQISDYGQMPDGTAFIVMEYLKGHSLSKRIQQTQGALPLNEVLQIGWQLADSLAAAHAKDIVHRDINIIYSVSLRKSQKTIQRRRRDDVDASSEWKSHISRRSKPLIRWQ